MKPLTGRAREFVVMAASAAVLLALPWLLTFIGGYRELATRIVIWAIFALGFDLLIGLTGLLSFGHAAMWGTGSYVAGYYLLHYGPSAAMALTAGILTAAVLSFGLGLLTLRRHGIYFAILTLAFAQMLYYAALAPLQQWTGGENGLTGLPTAELFGVQMRGPAMYWIVAGVAFVAIYVARRIVRSPYGLVLRAMRSNGRRLEATGFDVQRYKLVAFVISGVYAGVAGSLYAVYETYVPTDSLHWVTSGQVVMMGVVGGLGTLFGPMIGAGFLLYLQNVLSAKTEQWLLLQGLIFMAVVIFFPQGFAGAVRWVRARRAPPALAKAQVAPRRVAGEGSP
jgi:branched-chain amino acid transport system permease protein